MEVVLGEPRLEVGFAVIAALPEFCPSHPSDREDVRSNLRLYEDGREIGPPHASHQDIRDRGGGRYSHWGHAVYFSSSDGSDPLTNGRSYRVQYPTVGSAPEPLWDIPATAIRHARGHGYVYRLPALLQGWPGDDRDAQNSRLLLFEDGALLGEGHATHEALITRGGGRYSHWSDQVFFSASDNSNPRRNGRRYALGVRPQTDHRYAISNVPRPPSIDESLPALVIAEVSDGERITVARPTVEVVNPDPDLMYYFELDVRPTFDSRFLHRRPRLMVGWSGAHPLFVHDRCPDFSPRFTPPYRLGALAPPLDEAIDARQPRALRWLAHRLGFGIPHGHKEIGEVYAFVVSQTTPSETDTNIRDPLEVLARDRGFCGAVNQAGAVLLDELGYRTRRAAVSIPRLAGVPFVSGHSSAEVYFDSRWHIFDPFLQFHLPGIDFADFARDPTLPSYPILTLKRTEELRSFSDAELAISMRDFAAIRRYDRFDSFGLTTAASPEEERRLFAGEPAEVPEIPFEELWPVSVMDVYLRVRGLRASMDEITFAAASRRALKPPSAVIAGTPWTTLKFQVDLSAAYAAGDANRSEDSAFSSPIAAAADAPRSDDRRSEP